MRKSLRVLGGLAVIALALSACGGADSGGAIETPGSETQTAPPPTVGAKVQVDVADSEFKPTAITAKVGDEITWSQTGKLPHSITADDGSFDSSPTCPESGCMSAGDTFTFKATTPGTIAYFCKVHGAKGGVGMAGTVTVTA